MSIDELLDCIEFLDDPTLTEDEEDIDLAVDAYEEYLAEGGEG